MKKILAYVLSCIMIISCFMMPVNIIPVSAAPDLSNKEIYFKQKSGSKYCTIDSLAMVFRRKAILDGNEDWQVIMEDSMVKYKDNWKGGLSNSAAYKNMKYNL